MVAPTGQASASGPGPNTLVPVPSGITAAALPGARVTGDTPPQTLEIVSFILRERNLGQLKAVAEYGTRRFVSVRQFARRYGQSPFNVAQLRIYLARFGIRTRAYPDRVVVVATGTAEQFDRALSVRQHEYHVPGRAAGNGMASIPAQNVHGTAQSPMLPYRIARYVLAILGLTNYGPYVSQAAHADTSLAKQQAGSSNRCLALTGLPRACQIPADFAANYGLNPLYRRGAGGAGQTLAIVTLAALDPGAPKFFWRHIAHIPSSRRRLTVQNIDGGPGAPNYDAESYETDLDVEQSGALAPYANVIVYQAPNTTYGFADAFFTAASQNVASTVSASWIESETAVQASIALSQESPAFQAVFDQAFLEFAAQGQSNFAAAGDFGAYGASGDQGTTNLSVGSPSNSPYVTSAGGTTLPWKGQFTGPDGTAPVTVRAQRTWGWDYLWKPIAAVTGDPLAKVAKANVAGSGGGFSVLEPTPAYQQRTPGTHNFSAVRYLIPTDYQTIAPGLVEPTEWRFNPAPRVRHGYNTGRAVPDISTDADPETGYLLYSPIFASVGQPALQGAWGGTSFVAPQLNGSAAVIDSYLGHRVGFWNPASYAAARWVHSPFTVLQRSGTSSDNLYYTGNPGQPYNQGSGLGYPNLSRLAADLAALGRR